MSAKSCDAGRAISGCCGKEQTDWMSCALCRACREGASTLQRAQVRRVEWPETNTGLTNPIEEPVPHTSVDDAFAAMMQFMTISTRKCKAYHGSHKPHPQGSPEERHHRRYHSSHYKPPVISNPLMQPARVEVRAAPGTYAVTAARWDGGTETKHVVRLEPGQSVNLTLSV